MTKSETGKSGTIEERAIEQALPHIKVTDGPDGPEVSFFDEVRLTDDGLMLWDEAIWDCQPSDVQNECDCMSCKAARSGEFHPIPSGWCL
jgi:hypothetical protein